MNAKVKVLIVDDEIIPAMALCIELEDLGYELCSLASSGEQAIKIAEHENPSIVLMDIRLSGVIDGIEAARQIKAGVGIPVIYMTGYPDDETKEAAGVTEPYEYLVKPVRNIDITDSIDAALRRAKGPSGQQGVE